MTPLDLGRAVVGPDDLYVGIDHGNGTDRSALTVWRVLPDGRYELVGVQPARKWSRRIARRFFMRHGIGRASLSALTAHNPGKRGGA